MFPQGSTCLVVLWIQSIHDRISCTWLSHPMAGLPRPFHYPIQPLWLSEPPCARTEVWALSISLAATLEIDVSFSSSAYLDVSVQRVPFIYLCIQYMMTEVFSAGFPHSDIGGSPDICSSPPLFAAYHVLHRLSVPRHPPCALSCLTFRHTVALCFLKQNMTWFLTSSRLSSFLKIRAYVFQHT